MMEKIYEFPDRRIIEEKAGAWLIKLNGDAPSSADQQALCEWLNRSPAHREELNNLAVFLGKMNVLTELAVPLGKSESQPEYGAFNIVHRALFSHNRATVAAMVFVLGIATAFTSWLTQDSLIVSNGLYATAVGQQQSTLLADGSIIHLNTNSQMEVAYNEHYRKIHRLQGEGHFTVAKIPARPFQVYAGSERIQAVGTMFSVRFKEKDVNITVTEDRVALA